MDFSRIINEIMDKSAHPGTMPDFGSELYIPIRFDRKNFSKIGVAAGNKDAGENNNSNKRKVAFIDGGNNEILSSPGYCLHLIRVYCCIYINNKRSDSRKYEFFCLSSSVMKQGKITYEVKIYPVNYSIEIGDYDSFDNTLSQGGHRVNPSMICEAVRKLAEIDVASRISKELNKGDIIVRDGDLLASTTYDKEFYDMLFRNAESRGVAVCGISKTTGMLTDTGHSLQCALEKLAPEGAWYYNPLAENKNQDHPADIFIVKLNEKSRYIFRLDIYKNPEYTNKDNNIDFLKLLVDNSNDPVFKGYPYGMIEADRFARVSNSESEYMLAKIKVSAGKRWDDIEKDMNSINAHEILDNIS